MKAAEGSLGRVFVLRLEDGDSVPDCIVEFAEQHGVTHGFLTLVGGIAGGEVVAGPVDGESPTITPVMRGVHGVHEAAALGTIFPDADGKPSLHLHAAMGRGEETVVGCARPGLDIWRIGEVVLVELKGIPMARLLHPEYGIPLLAPVND